MYNLKPDSNLKPVKPVKLAVVLAGLLAAVSFTACGNDSGMKGGGMGASLIEQVYDLPYEEVDAAELDALEQAITDEYKARAVYSLVIDDFGCVDPFCMIVESEQVHIDALKAIYNKYEIDVPADPWDSSNTPSFSTLSAACAAGVQAEIDNAALYDNLLPTVNNEDIIFVFEALQGASDDNHLEAFQNCQ